jgi:hypothetical protein
VKDILNILEKLIGHLLSYYWLKARLQGAILYIEGVRSLRRLVILASLAIFCLMILSLGVMLIPLGIVLFLPWPPEVKAGAVLILGALYLSGALIMLAYLFSERRWLRISGAVKVLERFVKD